VLVDLRRQRVDLFDDAIRLDIGLVVMLSQLAADLVLALRGDQQDGTLHCRQARQDEIEEDERVRVESGVAIAEHPPGQEDERADNEAP